MTAHKVTHVLALPLENSLIVPSKMSVSLDVVFTQYELQFLNLFANQVRLFDYFCDALRPS